MCCVEKVGGWTWNGGLVIGKVRRVSRRILHAIASTAMKSHIVQRLGYAVWQPNQGLSGSLYELYGIVERDNVLERELVERTRVQWLQVWRHFDFRGGQSVQNIPREAWNQRENVDRGNDQQRSRTSNNSSQVRW
jgi:hypothetical protein